MRLAITFAGVFFCALTLTFVCMDRPCLLYLATAAAGLFHKLGDLAGINIFGCMDGKLEGIGDGSRTAV